MQKSKFSPLIHEYTAYMYIINNSLNNIREYC